MTNKPKLEQPGQGFPGLSQRLLKEPALHYFVTGHKQLTLCVDLSKMCWQLEWTAHSGLLLC